MRKTKHTNVFIVFAIFILIAFLAFSATPEKPYPAVQEGDRLHASWLMGMFNVIYDWAQTTNNDFTQHVANSTAHGVTGEVVGTTDTQSLTNKTLDSSNSITGDAIKSGTVASARIASTLTSKTMGTGCTWGGTAVPVANGGTGATTAANARTNLGVAYGTTAGTVCQGNDSRLSNARTPTSHTHGSITNDGKVGTTAKLPLITGTGGAVTAGSFGTAANTFCQGNDSRLSNARTPTSHTHGSITNDGKVGTTANLPLITGTGGVVQAGSFGTAANTFCEGNDSRFGQVKTSRPSSPVNGDIWIE